VYGDIDTNPTNGNGQREAFLSYYSTVPGLLSESRRHSDLKTGTCDAGTTTACAQTLYSYLDSFGLFAGKMTSMLQKGFSYDSSGTLQPFTYTTTYSYDSAGKGRLTTIDGPLAGSDDVTVFEYYADNDTDQKRANFLQNFKRKKDSTNFVTQSALVYDFFGNAIRLQDPDGTLTCLTFDSARNFFSQKRETMAGQTDCTANSLDLVTIYPRDSALRLRQLTRPDGSCLFYEYDTRGRLLKTKRRDDCNAASSGDREPT